MCSDILKMFTDVKGLQQSVDSFIKILSDLGNTVEKEKMIAIGLRNSYKSIAKDRERQQQKLQVILKNKYIEKNIYSLSTIVIWCKILQKNNMATETFSF